jgi:small subunit ribosomal protein S4
MTKRIKSKHKVDRRLGANIWGRPKSPYNSRAYGPGQHGQRASAKPSDYKIQLQAKQKLKNYYGNINERQFRNIYKEASRRKGNTGENLVGILESRLDAVIYRAKFAVTVFQARQLINHGHVKVNGKRVNISSYKLKENDEIEIKDASKQLPIVLSATQLKERDVPEYIVADHKKMSAKLSRVPTLDEIPYPAIMEPNLVVEYYSR